MEKPIRPCATRRHLLRFALTAGCGVLFAAFPASLRQEPGAWPFAPGMALADDRRDDDRDDREDDREDREDDRDDDRDDRDDDRDDDDNSGPGGGDDDSSEDDDNSGGDDDNSGPGNGGDDDNDNDGGGDDGGGDDNSGPGNGGDDDNDDNSGTRYDDDGDDDNSDRPSTNRRIRNITVQYQDGWIERIVDGQYELIDNLNRRVILRPATVEDFNRMMALS